MAQRKPSRNRFISNEFKVNSNEESSNNRFSKVKYLRKFEQSKQKLEEPFEDEGSSSIDEEVSSTGSRFIKNLYNKNAQITKYNQRSNHQFNDKQKYDFNSTKITSSSDISDQKIAQKKSYQKSYHYKSKSGISSVDVKSETKSTNVGTLAQRAGDTAKKAIAAIKNAIPGKIALIAGGVILLITALALIGIMLLAMLNAGLQTAYLFTESQATVIEQRFTDKELDYLEMITKEAQTYTGDFNASISYDPVGHDPHEVLSLFNVLLLSELDQKEVDKYKFDLDTVDNLIDQLIEARYQFTKETETIQRNVQVENEDGSIAIEQRTTTMTYLTSRTNSISNIIAGQSYSTPANTQEFIEAIGSEVQKVAYENDLYASVIMAQAILETGSGSSGLSKPPYFNLFGIKGAYQGNSVTMYTNEDDGLGNLYTISSRFRDYPSYTESIQDYAIVMKNQPRPGFYSPTYKSNTNSYREATAYLTGTYATDTQYGTKLNRIIEQNGLTRFDSPPSINNSEQPQTNNKRKIEKDLSGNIFSLTEYERELYNQTLEYRGLMAGYDSPIQNHEINEFGIHNLYGLAWNTDTKKRYTTDGLVLKVPSGKNIVSQISGTISNVSEKNGKAVVSVKSKGTVTIDYGYLDNINVKKGDYIRKGQTIGKSSSNGLLLNATDNKNKALNPLIIMNYDSVMPYMYNATIPGVNTGSNPTGNNQLNTNMAGKSYDDADVQQLFDVAKKYIGFPYVFGGASPGTSFDCSGFIYWVFKEAGLKNWSRTTANSIYYNHTAPISEAEARPGDLVFFENTYNAGERFTHVGIYAGDGIMLHAGDPIGFTSFKTNYWQKHLPTFGRLSQD